MSSYDKKNQNLANINNTNLINSEISSIIDLIIEDETYEEGKNKIRDLFKFYISNEKVINICLTIINNIIILKGNSKHKILSTIPEICEINPKLFFTHVDIILSIFQSCLTDDNSPYYSQISQYFGDTVKVLLNELNSENYNTYFIDSENQQNMNNNLNTQKNLLLVYTKFKLFCLSNIKSSNTGCQICGTLCLTSFIENCSFNYTNNENLKCIFDNLCIQINNPNFPGKLEILNCFISLVFSSEEKYIPYSIMTLNIIMQFINDQEWLIRKFALNIIYTMLYYCKKEIIEKKDFIIQNLKSLTNETNIEVKEIAEQIYRMITEEEPSYNNRIAFLSDSLLGSTNSKFSSGEQSKNNYLCNFSNKKFKLPEEEKNGGNTSMMKNKKSAPRGASKKKLQNSFVKNNNNKYKFDKSQVKAKSDQKRKTNNKHNDITNSNFIDNSSSKKLFPSNKKYPNNSNKNITNNRFGNTDMTHMIKQRKIFSDNLSNKSRNKKVPPSRNSVDRFYGMQKKPQMSTILKSNGNNQNNNITTEFHNKRNKSKENKLDFYSSEKIKKMAKIRQKEDNKNLSHNKYSKKFYPNNLSKNQKIKNLKSNNFKVQQIKGRNEIKKPNKNNLVNNTINTNNSHINNKSNHLTMNKIPSFGPGSEPNIHNPMSFDEKENSEYIEEIKFKDKNYDKDNDHNMNNIQNSSTKIKIQKKNYPNGSSESSQKMESKNHILNRSVENNNLNFSGNEFNINDDKEDQSYSKVQNTVGNTENRNYNKNNPLFQKYEKSSINKDKNIFKNRNNSSNRNNKIKRITKLNKKRMSKEIKNNSKININNINNINKEKKNSQDDIKNKFSPGNQLSNSVEIQKLFHSFSNNGNDSKNNKNNEINKNIIKNDSKKMSHKANHSLQINNNSQKVNSKIKNMKSKYNNNNQKQIKKKIQIQKKVNNNKKITEKKETDIEENNARINNNVICISDDVPCEEMASNDLNFDLKGDESIELKFKEYKNETSKIINDLKLQVSFLKTTLGNFEESNKQKEKLNKHVKNKDFTQAFETAVEIGSIQDIYYVIKKFQLSSEQEDIPANVLGGIMKILCEDILSCENLRLITMFILKNICDKKITFDKDLNKEINNVFFDLYNKRKELCLMKSDITNILKIGNYFSRGV